MQVFDLGTVKFQAHCTYKLNFFKPQITVRIDHQVPFGKSIYIVGNIPQLGSWSLNDAVLLNWQQGDKFAFWSSQAITVTREQAKSGIEFKFIINDSLNPQPEIALWSSGANIRVMMCRQDLDFDQAEYERYLLWKEGKQVGDSVEYQDYLKPKYDDLTRSHFV